MGVINDYFQYIKNNPQKYWFRAKWFGWGWTPATWQGWIATIILVGTIVFFSQTLTETASFSDVLLGFLLPTGLVTSAFIYLAYKTGEKPRWSWGKPKDN
jgi:hypothetical protein